MHREQAFGMDGRLRKLCAAPARFLDMGPIDAIHARSTVTRAGARRPILKRGRPSRWQRHMRILVGARRQSVAAAAERSL